MDKKKTDNSQIDTSNFYDSHKKQQSELGVTGECSPNMDLCRDVAMKLIEEFDHNHDTVTKEDCFLFIADTHLGDRVDQTQSGMSTYLAKKGCDVDHVRMLSKFLENHPRMIHIFAQSIQMAVLELHQQNPDPHAPEE